MCGISFFAGENLGRRISILNSETLTGRSFFHSRTSCQQLRRDPRWAQDARNNGWSQRWRDATQSARVTDSSDGPPSSRDDFFFPSPLQIREGLTIPTMSIIPRNQPIAALLVHQVGARRSQSVKQGNWILEFVFLTSAHLTAREGAHRDTARLLTKVIKIPKPTLEALCCQKGRGLNHT